VVEPLDFRCTSCGNCCRLLRVAVTARDVLRLATATGAAPDDLVEWLEPDAVDMTGEPESFVELSRGRRLMVLRQSEGACTLLGEDNLCRAYAARPRDCRAYPFDFERADPSGKRHLALLPLEGCEYAEDGAQDRAGLEAEDEARFVELCEFQAQIAAWNRVAKHRRRLGRIIGSGDAFLAFALARLADADEALTAPPLS
jgi:Fe-S-cluster containining protein